MPTDAAKTPAWTPTKVQFLYRHLNDRYYVRTFAGGKEKWTSLKTTLLSVAKNRMKEHLDAAEHQKSAGESAPAMGKLTFGEVTETYRQQLQASDVRPNTKAYRNAGIKLVFKSWVGFVDLTSVSFAEPPTPPRCPAGTGRQLPLRCPRTNKTRLW